MTKRRILKKQLNRQRKEIERAANRLSRPLGYRSRLMRKVYTVAVKGDARAYEPVIELSGPLDWERISTVSTLLTNRLRVSRVVVKL